MKNLNMKIINAAFENVAEFKHLGTSKNLAHEEIKSRLSSGNA
jgi:hypothetical protein